MLEILPPHKLFLVHNQTHFLKFGSNTWRSTRCVIESLQNHICFFFWRAANGFGCFCCRNINSIHQQLLLILILGNLERLNSVQPEWLIGLFHYLFLNNYYWSVIFLVSIYAKKHISGCRKFVALCLIQVHNETLYLLCHCY